MSDIEKRRGESAAPKFHASRPECRRRDCRNFACTIAESLIKRIEN